MGLTGGEPRAGPRGTPRAAGLLQARGRDPAAEQKEAAPGVALPPGSARGRPQCPSAGERTGRKAGRRTGACRPSAPRPGRAAAARPLAGPGLVAEDGARECGQGLVSLLGLQTQEPPTGSADGIASGAVVSAGPRVPGRRPGAPSLPCSLGGCGKWTKRRAESSGGRD